MKIFSPILPIVEAAGITDYGIRHREAWNYWPDSCWLQSRRPLFVPDFAPEFLAIPALAAKTVRLGKCVALRFAPRYISPLTAALIILPARTIKEWSNGGYPPASDLCFDNALVLGDRPIADGIYEDGLIKFTLLLHSGEQKREVPLSANISGIYETIVEVSKTNTLKMGDVILQPCTPLPVSGSDNCAAFPIFEHLSAEILAADDNLRPLLLTNFK